MTLGRGGDRLRRDGIEPDFVDGHGHHRDIKDFEAALAELEAIVKKLEEGDLTLESSLALYERGVQLSRFCHTRLEEAERRIEVLNERGELKPAPKAGREQ